MSGKLFLAAIFIASILTTSVKAQGGQLYHPKPPLAELPDGRYLLLGNSRSFIPGNVMGAMFLEKIGNRVVGAASDFPNREVLGCFAGTIASGNLLVNTSIATYHNSSADEGWILSPQQRLDLGKLTQPSASWANQIAQESRTRDFFSDCKTMFSSSSRRIQSLASLTDGIHLLGSFPGYAPYGEEYFVVEKQEGDIVGTGGLMRSDDDMCFQGKISANRQIVNAKLAYYDEIEGLVHKNNQRLDFDILIHRLPLHPEFINARQEIEACKRLLN